VLAPTNYFFGCLANALGIASYIVVEKPQGAGWLLDLDPFEWPESLADHFIADGHKVKQLRTTSLEEMNDCIDALSLHFLDNTAGVPARCGDLAPSVSEFLADLQRVVQKKDLGKTTMPELAQMCKDIIYPRARKGSKELRNRKTDGLIKKLLDDLVGPTTVALPGYLAGEMFRLAKRLAGPVTIADLYSDKIYGPYFVVRKARSAVTNQSMDSELIVRDLLWLRPLEIEPRAEGVRVEDQSTPTNALGYYISAVDRQVFEITSFSIRGDFVLLDGVAFLNASQTKSICMYMPRLPLQSEKKAAFASIIGMLRNRARTGSWSVLAVRPTISDTELLRYHFTLSFFADCFSSANYKSKVGDYDTGISQVYETFASKKLCGVLFSRNWLDRARKAGDGQEIDGVTSATLTNRLKAFDNCFEYTDEHMTILDSYIDSIIEEEQELFERMDDQSRGDIKRIFKSIYRRAEQTAINPKAIGEQSAAVDCFSDASRSPALPYKNIMNDD
jgi:hypothetical protein